MTNSYYPPPAFSFSVAIASASPQADINAAFQEVSGIEPRFEVEGSSEGGVNSYVRQLPGAAKHGNLLLKRGYVKQASLLADWAAQAVGSTLGAAIKTDTISVFLLGPDGKPQVTWTFMNAWPVNWEVGPLDSNSDGVLTESLEISYTTVTRELIATAS